MAKKTKKKASRKKTTRKASSSRSSAAQTAKTKARKIPSTDKPRTKSEFYGIIADQTELTKKQVGEVFDTMNAILAADLSKRGPGVANIPGMMKIVVQRKPATKARKGINPFTGEETTFKAKPARNVVKVRPLKNLKELV